MFVFRFLLQCVAVIYTIIFAVVVGLLAGLVLAIFRGFSLFPEEKDAITHEMFYAFNCSLYRARTLHGFIPDEEIW